MDVMTETTQTNKKIGVRIRNLRKNRKLSVRELAEKSGLSAIAISKIERDQVSPTLKSLEQLAGALEVKLIDLFLEDLDNEVIINRYQNNHSDTTKEMNLASLASGLRDQNLEPYFVEMKAGDSIECSALSEAGEVFVWCLRGTAAFNINQKAYQISEEENMLFRSYMAFSVENDGLDTNAMLFVFLAPLGRHFANQMLN